jgi:transcriptional antiterminator NusG
MGYDIISGLVERNVVKGKKSIKELRPVLPGYVFFESGSEPDWKGVAASKYIYYPLQYSDSGKQLKGSDLTFVKWLKTKNGNNGVVKISKAMEIGNRIKIIEGPLKEMEGNIVRINKRQKCAEVKIEGEGIKHTMWLSYEYIL